MTRRPPNATAWCALHERYMNDRYIHKRRCVFRGRHGPCKHLRWLFISGSEEGRHDSCRE